MLTVNQCEMKFKEIRHGIEYTPKTVHGLERIEMLKRLREAYGVEHLKAVEREARNPLRVGESLQRARI